MTAFRKERGRVDEACRQTDRRKAAVCTARLRGDGVAASQAADSLADHEATIPRLDHHEGAVDDKAGRDDAEQPRTGRLLRECG